MEKQRVAFLGLGRMGREMARHVVEAGHDLTVWNRTPGRAAELVSRGAREAASAAEAAQDAHVVVLMLFGPDSVRAVLPDVLHPGVLVVDSTTIGPGDASEFAARAVAAGARYADAPVLGSVGPARSRSLGVVAGCSATDWPDVEAVVRLWGEEERIRRVGEVGAGSALKLVVNQGIGVVSAGLGEALRISRRFDLDQDMVLDVLGNAMFGRVVQLKRAMLESNDFSATQFALDGLAKDLALVTAGDEDRLPVTAAALDHMRAALAAGASGQDFAAVVGHVMRS